jgi:hypothetical protein
MRYRATLFTYSSSSFYLRSPQLSQLHNGYTQDHPGVTAQILVDGQPLKEHINDDEAETPNTIVRYIEAEPRAKFEVRVELLPPFQPRDLHMMIYTDGLLVKRWCHIGAGSVFRAGGSVLKGIVERQGDRCFSHEFSFADLDVGECKNTSLMVREG